MKKIILTALIFIIPTAHPASQDQKKSHETKRSLASLEEEKLIDRLVEHAAEHVEEFSRPVKMYHRTKAKYSKDKLQDLKAFVLSRIEGALDYDSKRDPPRPWGFGFFAAIDPESTYEFGDKLIVLDIPKNFRFFRLDLNQGKELNCPETLKGILNPRINVGDKNSRILKEVFRRLDVKAIRYSYRRMRVPGRTYAFTLVDPSLKGVSLSLLPEGIANVAYQKCVKSKTCSIGTSFNQYREDEYAPNKSLEY
jgi:hypothetical protein